MNHKLELFKNRFNNHICHMIMQNDVELIIELINRDNINNSIYDDNLTALHIAVITNSNKIIPYLLENGANVKIQNKNELDCFDLAVRYDNREFLSLFKNFYKN